MLRDPYDGGTHLSAHAATGCGGVARWVCVPAPVPCAVVHAATVIVEITAAAAQRGRLLGHRAVLTIRITALDAMPHCGPATVPRQPDSRSVPPPCRRPDRSVLRRERAFGGNLSDGLQRQSCEAYVWAGVARGGSTVRLRIIVVATSVVLAVVFLWLVLSDVIRFGSSTYETPAKAVMAACHPTEVLSTQPTAQSARFTVAWRDDTVWVALVTKDGGGYRVLECRYTRPPHG